MRRLRAHIWIGVFGVLPALAHGSVPQEQRGRIQRLEKAVLAPCYYTETVGQQQSEIAVQMRVEIAKRVEQGRREVSGWFLKTDAGTERFWRIFAASSWSVERHSMPNRRGFYPSAHSVRKGASLARSFASMGSIVGFHHFATLGEEVTGDVFHVYLVPKWELIVGM